MFRNHHKPDYAAIETLERELGIGQPDPEKDSVKRMPALHEQVRNKAHTYDQGGYTVASAISTYPGSASSTYPGFVWPITPKTTKLKTVTVFDQYGRPLYDTPAS